MRGEFRTLSKRYFHCLWKQRSRVVRDPRFDTSSDDVLTEVHLCPTPWFNFSAALLKSQLVCLLKGDFFCCFININLALWRIGQLRNLNFTDEPPSYSKIYLTRSLNIELHRRAAEPLNDVPYSFFYSEFHRQASEPLKIYHTRLFRALAILHGNSRRIYGRVHFLNEFHCYSKQLLLCRNVPSNNGSSANYVVFIMEGRVFILR